MSPVTPLPGVTPTLPQRRTGIWGRIRGWKEAEERDPSRAGDKGVRAVKLREVLRRNELLKIPLTSPLLLPCSPQILFLLSAGLHVPVVRCPGRPLLLSRRPEERDVPSGHPRPSGAGRAAAAPSGRRLCRRHSDCRALPEGEGPNFALVSS